MNNLDDLMKKKVDKKFTKKERKKLIEQAYYLDGRNGRINRCSSKEYCR